MNKNAYRLIEKPEIRTSSNKQKKEIHLSVKQEVRLYGLVEESVVNETSLTSSSSATASVSR